MSGEFRWVGHSHMHEVLSYGVDEFGRHELSQLLYGLYKAAAPLERSCAWHEAGDSGPDDPISAAYTDGAPMIEACEKLIRYIELQRDLINRIVREEVRKLHTVGKTEGNK